jgi:hypothetical protein
MCCVIFTGILLVAFLVWACWTWSNGWKGKVARLAVLQWLQGLRAALDHALCQLPHFTPEMSLFSADVRSGVAIDNTRGRVCLFNEIGKDEGLPRYKFRVVGYEDILISEIVEGANMVATTVHHNTLSRALVGGMLAGEAGAVIGGLSGPTTTRQTRNVQNLDIRITVNDPSEPIHTLRLLGGQVEIGGDSPHYKTKLEEASLWHGRMNVIIHQGAQSRAGQSQTIEVTELRINVIIPETPSHQNDNRSDPSKSVWVAVAGVIGSALTVAALLAFVRHDPENATSQPFQAVIAKSAVQEEQQASKTAVQIADHYCPVICRIRITGYDSAHRHSAFSHQQTLEI